MEHSHAAKKEHLTLLDTNKRKTASEKNVNGIERSSAKKRAETDNDTVCSDDIDDTCNNNDND
eukprot:4585423-Ditylum_brightwellii.AAC.1